MPANTWRRILATAILLSAYKHNQIKSEKLTIREKDRTCGNQQAISYR